MPTPSRQFWIGVVSREHVQLGVKGGFIQLNHGKKAPLQRLRAGDGLAMYSPRTSYPDGQPLQCFTAIGVVNTGEVYQVEMSEAAKPYRVGVKSAKRTGAPRFALATSRFRRKISLASPRPWASSLRSPRMRANLAKGGRSCRRSSTLVAGYPHVMHHRRCHGLA